MTPQTSYLYTDTNTHILIIPRHDDHESRRLPRAQHRFIFGTRARNTVTVARARAHVGYGPGGPLILPLALADSPKIDRTAKQEIFFFVLLFGGRYVKYVYFRRENVTMMRRG